AVLGAPAPLPADGSDRTWAVIGPGTGLGVGALVAREGRTWALATEGGHASFAPGTPEEIAILERLSGEFGRVSNERIVSGGGLGARLGRGGPREPARGRVGGGAASGLVAAAALGSRVRRRGRGGAVPLAGGWAPPVPFRPPPPRPGPPAQVTPSHTGRQPGK